MKNRNKQTKFPVARIKKIMQKDEEVGKVAQATPVVISKALELFLALIIEKSSAITLERGSKRVEAYHLKHAVENTDMLDFLKELVQDVPDPSAGGTIDLEAEANADSKKKRAKGKRAANAGPTLIVNPVDPDAPPPPKRKRKKKTDAAPEAAATAAAAQDASAAAADTAPIAGTSDANKMMEVSVVGSTKAEDDDYDEPEVPQRRRMFDEDVAMEDDEYDEDDSTKPPTVPEETMSNPRRGSTDEDYEE